MLSLMKLLLVLLAAPMLAQQYDVVLANGSGQHRVGKALARVELCGHGGVDLDDAGVMNRSISDTGGQVLVVSQFTLYGDTSGGRRPSWIAAARPEYAEPIVAAVVDALVKLGAQVQTGRFRAVMDVELVNDGPTTVWIEL